MKKWGFVLSLVVLTAGCAVAPLPRTVCSPPPIEGQRVMVVPENNWPAPTPVLTVVEARLRSAGVYPVAAPRGWSQPQPDREFDLEVGMRSEGNSIRVDLRAISRPGRIVVGNGSGSAVDYHGGYGRYRIPRSVLEEEAAARAVSSLLCSVSVASPPSSSPPTSSAYEWTVPGPSWFWGGGGVFSSGGYTRSGWEFSGGKLRRVWERRR